MNWPNDVDGEVLKNLEENGFDFDEEVDLDFIVDFDHWPLSDDEKKSIQTLYPNCTFIDPDEDALDEIDTEPYVQLTINTKLSYDFVVNTQKEITNQMKQYGGWCDSWGVYQE